MKLILISGIILLLSIITSADVNQIPKHKIIIAMLDTGINLDDKSIPICDESKAIVGDTLQDYFDHGSIISEMIKEEINDDIDFCILMVKYTTPGILSERSISNFIEGLEYVSKLNTKVDIFNISASGNGFNLKEKKYIDIILKKGIKIVAASGNQGLNLDLGCDVYPACYDKEIIVIGAKDFSLGNYGKIVDFYDINKYTTKTGKVINATSGATGHFSAGLAKVLGRMK